VEYIVCMFGEEKKGTSATIEFEVKSDEEAKNLWRGLIKNYPKPNIEEAVLLRIDKGKKTLTLVEVSKVVKQSLN